MPGVEECLECDRLRRGLQLADGVALVGGCGRIRCRVGIRCRFGRGPVSGRAGVAVDLIDGDRRLVSLWVGERWRGWLGDRCGDGEAEAAVDRVGIGCCDHPSHADVAPGKGFVEAEDPGAVVDRADVVGFADRAGRVEDDEAVTGGCGVAGEGQRDLADRLVDDLAVGG